MEKNKKKRIRKYISWVLIVAVVALLAAMPAIASREAEEAGPQAVILETMAQRRDICLSVPGGGVLTAEESSPVTVPSQVKVTEYLVHNGDRVSPGQQIARVDRVSVMHAISEVQNTLQHLKEELENAKNETGTSAVKASAGGTVKILYAAAGENVQDVMLRHGALAVLSLDGFMAVQIVRDTELSGGNMVKLSFADGTEAEGRVESNLEGVLTVITEDKNYAPGTEVTVTAEDGTVLGSGALCIHAPWNATAYSGTVRKVRVREGDAVSAGSRLFDLENTGHDARFETLSRQHREYEKLMLELFEMYQLQAVTAPVGGLVSGVDDTAAYMLADSGSGYQIQLLANAPNGNDEISYINFVGQVAEVGTDGLIMKMNPQPFFVTDYKDLSSVPMDTSVMTESAVYVPSVPVYELSGEEWVQISTGSLKQGDILLFAGDASGGFVWLVRVSRGASGPEVPEEPSEPAEPTDPQEPSEPADPTQPTEPEIPDAPSAPEAPSVPVNPEFPGWPGGGFPQGGFPGMGGMPQEDSFSLYGLDTVTIASVTPEDHLTVQIAVDEQDIKEFYLGQEALVTVDALQGAAFPGTVTAISGSGVNMGGSSKFRVDVTVTKAEDMLPGMRASVSIERQMQENVLCIPVVALAEQGNRTLVYTGFDAETGLLTGPVAVATGLSDGEYVQVLSGLEEGQTVFYAYYEAPEIGDTAKAENQISFG